MNNSNKRTLCIVEDFQKTEHIAFTTLKINSPNYNPSNRDIYAFTSMKGIITKGIDIYLKLENFDHFITHNDFRIFYDKTMTSYEELELMKTFDFE